MPESEFLTPEELEEITGYKHAGHQKDWLEKNSWTYVLNGSGKPIVGRWFARMRLAGVKPTETGALTTSWQPDFSRLN